jgi:hypothetical protein
MDYLNWVPFHALLGTDGRLDPFARADLEAADIILGRDVASGIVQAFYGRETLERLVERDQTESLPVVAIDYDNDSTELEGLYALCVELKGSCDYQSGGKPPPNERVRDTVGPFLPDGGHRYPAGPN